MAIFEMSNDRITPLAETSFGAVAVYERGDLQRLLREHIDVLEDGLMVIAEEFGDWIDSSRRIDLLCLDRDANLVVIELKRTADGGHMELQAIRYAAMVSAMTFDQLVNACARHRNPGKPDTNEAKATILEFLGWSSPDEDRFAQEVRIILASADFGRELTTAVVWLNDHGLDIRCVRLKPYQTAEGRLLIDVQQLIPLPEVADFQTQIGVKRQVARQQNAERHEERLHWWSELLGYARTQTQLHANRAPSRSTWIPGAIGRTGFSLTYSTRRHESQVELWLSCGSAEASLSAFDQLKNQQEAIEQEFGSDLEWQDLPDRQGCRIRKVFPGGYRDPTEQWPAIHQQLVAAMIRLDCAMRPRVQSLKPNRTE